MHRRSLRVFTWATWCSVLLACVLALTGCSGLASDTGSGAGSVWSGSTQLSVDDVADSSVDFSKYEESRDTSAAGAVDASGQASASGEGAQDQYQTDPVPEGKPAPVEPEDVEIDESNSKTCYLTVSCATVLNHMDWLTPGKESVVPSDGVIFARTEVTYYDGESVFDVLKREMRNARIHLEYSSNPAFNSAYIEGINNLYERDCGDRSGWMYSVNGWYPNYGMSRYAVEEGDEIALSYTCDLGADLGA